MKGFNRIQNCLWKLLIYKKRVNLFLKDWINILYKVIPLFLLSLHVLVILNFDNDLVYYHNRFQWEDKVEIHQIDQIQLLGLIKIVMIRYKIISMMILFAWIKKRANVSQFNHQIYLKKVYFNSSLLKVFKNEVLSCQSICFLRKQVINVIIWIKVFL